MPITVTDTYHASVIALSGRFLGSIEGPSFRAKIDEMAAGGHNRIVVDLGGCDFIDSSGIGALIGGLRVLREAGGDMRLAAVEKRVKNVFMVTHLLGRVFEDFDTADEAARSFVERPEPKNDGL
jgi:anti-sigma B factor antagonist